jgi:hypothetical protein
MAGSSLRNGEDFRGATQGAVTTGTAPYPRPTRRVERNRLIPFSTCFHVVDAAIGNPRCTRSEYAPAAVLPRPLRQVIENEL